MRDFVKNNCRENGERPYSDLADEVFQRYFAGEDFIMNTATTAKRQGGGKITGVLECWSIGMMCILTPSSQYPITPSLHHSLASSLLALADETSGEPL